MVFSNTINGKSAEAALLLASLCTLYHNGYHIPQASQ